MTVMNGCKTRSAALGLRLSRKALRTAQPPITQLISAALKDPSLISFAAGLVDEQMLPVSEMQEISAHAFDDPAGARSALQYGDTLGFRPLREMLLKHIESLEGKPAADMGLSAGHVLLTTGSQQALYLIADTLLDSGDIVIAASPSYFVYTGALASLGAKVIGIPMDEQGMRVDLVEQTLEDLAQRDLLHRLKFIYCTSFYQNPTGYSLSLARRKALLRLVRKFSPLAGNRILIVEDAAYRELRYSGEDLPSIKSMDRRNEYTVLTQTFSKPFAPGLRVGYTVMPDDLLEQVLRQKGNHDFGSPNVCQWLASQVMQSGAYARHLKELLAGYRKKRDLMLSALEREIRHPGISWTRPDGGLYVWLTLPEGMSSGPDGQLIAACLQQGVIYVPGEYAFASAGRSAVPSHHLRLCFGQVPADRIHEGIARLSRAIQKVCAQQD